MVGLKIGLQIDDQYKHNIKFLQVMTNHETAIKDLHVTEYL